MSETIREREAELSAAREEARSQTDTARDALQESQRKVRGSLELLCVCPWSYMDPNDTKPCLMFVYPPSHFFCRCSS